MTVMVKCRLCETVFDPQSDKGCTKDLCSSCRTNRHRFALKAAMVRYMGGRCLLCGYDRCHRALSFHHLDPTQKQFGVAGAHCRAWSKIKAELNKCVCLCKNCHEEVEDALEWRPQDPILLKLQSLASEFKPTEVEFTRADWDEYHPAIVSLLKPAI